MQKLPLAVMLALGSTTALAATPINQTRPLNADAKVHISNVTGEVNVHGWDQNQVEITGSLGEGAKPLIVEGDAHDLRIKVEAEKSGSWLNWGGDSHMQPTVLNVRLPRGVTLDVDVVSADTDVADLAGGKIDVDSVSGRVKVAAKSPSVEIDSVSGNVELAGSADSVDIDTVSGDIVVPASASSRAKLETVSGDVRFGGGPFHKLEASTVSGDLAIHGGVTSDGDVHIETMSGDVELGLPADTAADLDASSFSGDIDSAFGKVEEPEHGPGSKLHTTLGAGGGKLSVETFSGDIRIRSGE
jgi:hypothetical protein